MGYWDRVRQRAGSLLGHFDEFELVINGIALTPSQIAEFQRMTGLAVLEPGRFWLDPVSGAMGREGTPIPLYQIYANTYAPVGRQRSLSERRSLFSQADLTGLWRVGSGP